MERSELLKLKAEIEADLAAVTQLLSREGREKKVIALVEAHRPRKTLTEMAEEIIKNIGKGFTVPDICFELRKLQSKWSRYQSPTVSGVINKLRQRNPPEIEVVVEGKGSRSGVYRYKNPVKK